MPRPKGIPGRQWTREEIEKAIADKEVRGIPYRETAARLEVSYECLRVQLHKYRTGKLKWKRAEQRATRFEIVEPMIERGARLSEIARAIGATNERANAFLSYHGWDAEVRRLYRDGEAA